MESVRQALAGVQPRVSVRQCHRTSILLFLPGARPDRRRRRGGGRVFWVPQKPIDYAGIVFDHAHLPSTGRGRGYLATRLVRRLCWAEKALTVPQP
jgi:hypothetical protein